MDQSNKNPDSLGLKEGFAIRPLSSEQTEGVVNMIRQHLASYEEAGSVLAASFRRLANFYETYTSEGAIYYVLTTDKGVPIGGVGLGPLAGLPKSEGIGEIRELVLEKTYRGQGMGAALLKAALGGAEAIGYKQIYLETTPEMSHARKLFERYGFHPIKQMSKEPKPPRQEEPHQAADMACYYRRSLRGG